jgi:hypothetical protein
MSPSRRGEENLESIQDRNEGRGAGHDKTRADQASRISNGEVAGGDRDDVPGGAYDVPPDLADNVSEADALKPRKPQR